MLHFISLNLRLDKFELLRSLLVLGLDPERLAELRPSLCLPLQPFVFFDLDGRLEDRLLFALVLETRLRLLVFKPAF